MTTIKEYKAMMECATDALKAVLCDPDGNCCINGADGDRKAVNEVLEKLSIAGGNLAPSLIRVIELAELTIHAQLVLMKELSKEGTQFPMAEKALSEI